MDVDELINKLFNTLNDLINRADLNVGITSLLNELLETLKIMENCIRCKNNIKEAYFDKSINEMDFYLVELEKGEREKVVIIDILDDKLTEIDDELSRKML